MNVLLVDDEAMQRELLHGFLEKQGYTIYSAGSGAEALKIFLAHPVELVLLDHRMPGMDGDELLARLKEISPLVRAIMITAYGSVDMAVKVMQMGADDFLEKPIDLEVLLAKLQQIEEQLFIAQDVEQVKDTIALEELPVRMVVDSEPMRALISMVMRAAPTPWTVFLRGETGTGKELIARLIHLLSDKKNGQFIELNCAAIPEHLFESELFGHERGAFTGADSRRRGVFEQAHGGTLLLDEVGELPLAMQAKLLRTLQEKKITRVGGEKPISLDVRIIAATNRDLKLLVEQGHFREDLFFRLNVIDIEIPPLRRRKKEIPALVHFFLEKFNATTRFDDQALNLLGKYNFPGNIRELEHVVQRVITLSRRPVITPSELPPEIKHFRGEAEEGDLNQRLSEVERQMLIDALELHHWVQTKAAVSLGISERVLRYKMEKANISKPKF
ncbi:MAG: sigma-54-dependent Fis family transcriptional regulator [Desulfobulbaceae bacterium]|nr:sigma-54-dependent Fis family transcriptional regulator [Desulfobulbaceae bacterium]